MKDETRESLELFIEKANELRLRNIAKYLDEPSQVKLQVSISSEHGEKVEYIGPDEEAVSAFLLPLRFFIQDRDDMSIRYLDENICNDPDLSTEWKQNIKAARAQLHQYLSMRVEPIIVYEPPPTLQEIVFTFIYGNYAHADKKYRARYKKWEQNKIMFSSYKMSFQVALLSMLSLIMYLSGITEQELTMHP
jgi:hypothetical protein